MRRHRLRASVIGGLLILSACGDGSTVSTTDTTPGSRASLPTSPSPEVDDPAGPPRAEWGGSVEVGQVYRFPLDTHCGIDVLAEFNGRNWWLAEQIEDFELAFDFVFGEIEVVSEDRIDFVLDGRTVARYEPRDDEFPGCD